MLTARAYDIHVEQLFDRVRQLHQVLTAAGIPYRIVGGLAVFMHVSERDPLRARLTADVDADVRPEEFARAYECAASAGVTSRDGVHRSIVHLYASDLPNSPSATTREGILLAPVADLVRMKLTSYRLKDKVHIQDLDGVGLITPEIETQLSALLLERLQEIRATE